MCVTSGKLLAEGDERPEITESDIARVKNKYSKVVLFGDSQLDTGNITQIIDVSIDSVGTVPYTLPLGAPFTLGRGNMAHQLFGDSFASSNPMKWSGSFRPLGIFDLSVAIKNVDNKANSDKRPNINMAQGGAKLLGAFPGNEKSVVSGIVTVAVEKYLKDGSGSIGRFFASSAKKIVSSIADGMSDRNIVLIDRVADQPKRFSASGHTFNEGDLAIIMAGGNDVIEQGYTGARPLNAAQQELSNARQELLKDVIGLGANA